MMRRFGGTSAGAIKKSTDGGASYATLAGGITNRNGKNSSCTLQEVTRVLFMQVFLIQAGHL